MSKETADSNTRQDSVKRGQPDVGQNASRNCDSLVNDMAIEIENLGESSVAGDENVGFW